MQLLPDVKLKGLNYPSSPLELPERMRLDCQPERISLSHHVKCFRSAEKAAGVTESITDSMSRCWLNKKIK